MNSLYELLAGSVQRIAQFYICGATHLDSSVATLPQNDEKYLSC
jgi:hypothetical protein